ncbi:Inositol phoshorylceramide synthase regulatory subunit kei1 [Madurella mycetomatis]|uniref:Inositol phoshorylceramide synthase regulatory subunit kei1 n=1 Tax=Madurella mycetomatis TaxID=100816 RepID=A0A175W4T0_9PEZI|nr:Inositol phoshorylceramide synthase regulatory subunit kei1 [Madurella mycetomatis]
MVASNMSPSRASWLRLPRPKVSTVPWPPGKFGVADRALRQSFLGLMSLQTGTELISLALVFNKATGLYGVLTLLTGYSLSALQVSAYLGSVFVLAVLALCIPHIRTQSPLHNLALAWVYALDTVTSAAYTAAFGTSWYRTVIQEPSGPAGAEEAAGSPNNGAVQRDASQTAEIKAAGDLQDVAASMVLVVAFTLIRVYFSLVIMSFARMTLLRFVDERMGETEQDDAAGETRSPFAVGAPLGDGWRGKLGRCMVLVGRGYWLGGRREDEEWARHVNSKIRNSRR